MRHKTQTAKSVVDSKSFRDALESEWTNAHAWLLIMQSFNFQNVIPLHRAERRRAREHKKHKQTTPTLERYQEKWIFLLVYLEAKKQHNTRPRRCSAWGDKSCVSFVFYKGKIELLRWNRIDSILTSGSDCGRIRTPYDTQSLGQL